MIVIIHCYYNKLLLDLDYYRLQDACGRCEIHKGLFGKQVELCIIGRIILKWASNKYGFGI
jgi:hypothetical protein